MQGADRKLPHVVCVTLPFQGHIKAMLGFAKVLHHRGFHVTFVNTEFNHKRLMRSGGEAGSLSNLPNFRFETIPDGLPPSEELDISQDVPTLVHAVRSNMLAPFRALMAKLIEAANPPVTSIVSDGFTTFPLTIAKELGIPIVLFFTIAACAFLAFRHSHPLIEKGILPLKDESYLTNGYLDMVVDCIPSMKNIRLRDLPSFLWTTDLNEIMFLLGMEGPERAGEASAIVIHTFDRLEQDILNTISSMIPNVFAIGPLPLLINQMPEDPVKSFGFSLWKEEVECLRWLDSKPLKSVVYVSFGSIATLTPLQLVEFAWGLANSKCPFLWIIRHNFIMGEAAILPLEFAFETKDRSLIANWCPQEKVLNHPSVGGFLTHSGWNSTIESIGAGVPMLCWPFFAEQQTNCKYCCDEWGIGIEIKNDVKRDKVESLIIELMEGARGKEMRKRVLELKALAEEATSVHGSSSMNLDKLIDQVLVPHSRWTVPN